MLQGNLLIMNTVYFAAVSLLSCWNITLFAKAQNKVTQSFLFSLRLTWWGPCGCVGPTRTLAGWGSDTTAPSRSPERRAGTPRSRRCRTWCCRRRETRPGCGPPLSGAGSAPPWGTERHRGVNTSWRLNGNVKVETKTSEMKVEVFEILRGISTLWSSKKHTGPQGRL